MGIGPGPRPTVPPMIPPVWGFVKTETLTGPTVTFTLAVAPARSLASPSTYPTNASAETLTPTAMPPAGDQDVVRQRDLGPPIGVAVREGHDIRPLRDLRQAVGGVVRVQDVGLAADTQARAPAGGIVPVAHGAGWRRLRH
jgi:hypothetical protein